MNQPMGPGIVNGSETEVKPKLHRPRKVLTCGVSERSAGKVTVGLVEIHPVEEVEDVGPELESVPVNVEGLGELRIDTRKPGAAIGVSAPVALVP